MIIAVLVLDFRAKSIHSLKEKRRILSSIKEKLRRRFNISIIESDNQDLWQMIQISIVMVGHSKVMIDKTFNQIEEFVLQNYPLEILKLEKDFL